MIVYICQNSFTHTHKMVPEKYISVKLVFKKGGGGGTESCRSRDFETAAVFLK